LQRRSLFVGAIASNSLTVICAALIGQPIEKLRW
jgi:hypothetical protein